MKKRMLSLVAMFAALSFASPAHAELKIGGDASVRLRGEFKSQDPGENTSDDLKWQYRIRLTGAADLGSGYFFKTMITNESTEGRAAGFVTIGYGNTEVYNLTVSNFYFGRMMQDSHYMMGRLPLGSFNNPIFDLAAFPSQPLDTPITNILYDRVYGINYGCKIGSGDMNATLVMLDNRSTGVTTATEHDGLFNDGYALHLSYKATAGNVTLEPQVLVALTNMDTFTQPNGVPNFTANCTPITFGANVGIPVGKSKLTCSGFYTTCDDADPDNAALVTDYHGYLLRAKFESGPFMAWFDYNSTHDETTNLDYNNTFLWAQYKINVHQSAMGTFTVQPTLRWLTSGKENSGAQVGNDTQTLRAELMATVTF